MTLRNKTVEVPSYDQLLNPTLEALHGLGSSASIDEIVGKVIENLSLPKEVVEQPHGRGNETELEYRLSWARTYLKKFGLIDNSARGVWSLSAEGMISQVVDPREVVRKVRQQDSSTLNADDTGQIVTGPDGNQTLDWPEDIAPKWRDTVIQILRELSPDAFERLCTRLLRESGFIEVEVTGKSGDGGIDGRGIIRVGGLISFNVLFQSKRYQENVGASVVRDFRGAMIGRADKGLIITTAGFTRDAKKEATRDGAPPIDLIDGYLLAEKLKELKLGITTELVEAVDVDKGWFTSI